MLLFDEVLNISNAALVCVWEDKKGGEKGRRGWHETKSQTDSIQGYNLAITGEAHKMQMLPPPFGNEWRRDTFGDNCTVG